MSELSARYNPREVEEKRLQLWDQKKPFHAEAGRAAKSKGPFTIVIPPPNVTGVLHMGHALNNTLQDILTRYKRMQGFDALWMPGTDHAGIATQNVVEKQLAKEGLTREQLGREKFMERLWEWKQRHGDTIILQLRRLGSSCDWDRTRFTMDEGYSGSVREVFIRLYERGLIYQGQYIINWCPRCQTALSDEEAEHRDSAGHLWHIKYPFKDDPAQFVTVATTRPETMLGDTAVAVNPKDERYRDLVGKVLVLPLTGREIRIIADDFVDREFGSGAVKVTPAHDPNDFAMGRRHNLEFVNILKPDGVLNENAGRFCGMDRFEGRKAVVKALEAEGFLAKIEPHANAVRRCYRCDTVVEPYLSRQWFVKMKPMADKALEAFRQGKPRLQPKRWEKVYENWLTDIRDWCISRQIWWGHRIPVWYDEKGNHFVARNEADARVQARAKLGKDVPLVQDPDVLDTWFSSWLWPFATLGWPADNRDLKYFYPTTALFTAPEIIFFWVARMVMAGIEFMGEVPFDDVILHGTVRDAKGRKMSKSLGNALDPLEIIEEYGADALRFSMILNSGQDIYISKEKFEIGRNFANKLWNASRFLSMNIKPEAKVDDFAAIDVTSLDLASRWIISRYQTALKEVTVAIDEYRYSEGENVLYEFFWATYCDWYLEIIKGKLDDVEVQKTAYCVLVNTLKMLHPFIPFVTEELYSQFKSKETILTLEAWPVPVESLADARAEAEMAVLIELVTKVRNVRAQWGIKQNDKIPCVLVCKNEAIIKLLKANIQVLQKLASIENVVFGSESDKIKNAVAGLAGDVKFLIPLSDLVDVDKEKDRIGKELAEAVKAATGLSGRLSSENFVSKAPAEVIAKERQRLAELEARIAELNRAVDSLV
ncbi:MAG: valine--tRNA ligase [Candidatus Omnitrophica bacterium]|nr:valine--tRNA ligase [Candidatus Omnitrophota bacterium]